MLIIIETHSCFTIKLEACFLREGRILKNTRVNSKIDLYDDENLDKTIQIAYDWVRRIMELKEFSAGLLHQI